jgi:ribosomal protein L7/L12
MDSDLEYKPDAKVVRTCRAFIRSLCEAYGHSQGMAVWDSVREKLGDRAASDIFLGMLIRSSEVNIVDTGPNFVHAIKELRQLTGWGLKETKDFLDRVRDKGPAALDVSNYDEERVAMFYENMRQIGATVE